MFNINERIKEKHNSCVHNSFDVYCYAFYIMRYMGEFSSLALTFLIFQFRLFHSKMVQYS